MFNHINNLNEIVFTLIILLQIYIFYYLIQNKRKIDGKNKQLMQFHLDIKFTNRILVNSLNTFDSASFCNSLIKQIEDYYNLEQVFIIDSVKMIKTRDLCTTQKNAVINFIKQNAELILKKLYEHKIKDFNIDVLDKKYVLYISKLCTTRENDGLVVCIERAPSLLDKNERISLENSINLLKNRLLYD